MFKYLANVFKDKFRNAYESQINIQYGIHQFIANCAFVQLEKSEHLILSSPSPYLGEVTVSTHDMRPMLTYKYWPKNMEFREEMPKVQCIIELRGLQVRSVGDTDWQLVTMEDERVKHLKDLFLAFAFYPSLRAEHKRKLEVVSAQAN